MAMNAGGEKDFSLPGFLVRFAAALLLVMLTYNPSRYSYVYWLRTAIAGGQAGALHALAGIVLLIGWTFFLKTTWASLGTLGLLLGGAFLASLVWVLVDFDLVKVESTTTLVWILLICVAALLAIGMSWSLWKRRASGQVEVDEIER